MDGCVATPLYHSDQPFFIHFIKYLRLSKCHSSLTPFFPWESGHRQMGAAAIHGRDGAALEFQRARRTGKQQRINMAVLVLVLVLDLLGL